jgi:hypothetical protein
MRGTWGVTCDIAACSEPMRDDSSRAYHDLPPVSLRPQMSEFTTDETADTLTAVGGFTIDDVPDKIQDIRLIGLLYIEILEVGDMVSTDDEIQDRANALKINHVAYWAYYCTFNAIVGRRITIRFSMNVVNPDGSFGSTEICA